MCLYVPLSVLYPSFGERLDGFAHLFLEVVGTVYGEFWTRRMLNKRKYFLRGKMLLKLHFEVLYRRVLFVMSIIYYFGDQNRGIPLATASFI